MAIEDLVNARPATTVAAMTTLAVTVPRPERRVPGARTERVTIVENLDTLAETARNPKRKVPDLLVAVEVIGPVTSVVRQGILAGRVLRKGMVVVEEMEAGDEDVVVVVVVDVEEVVVVEVADTNAYVA